ncbi:MAG: adenosylhomocysteinase [Desulfobacterales bacterium]|nr:adenosylhomocysteinase [Desulfobacterales bacterium]
MDMSFANQALCSEYMWKNGKKLQKKVYSVPKEIDENVALLKLQAFGIKIDKLTAEQKKYLGFLGDGHMIKLLVAGTVAYDSIETPFGKVENVLGGLGPPLHQCGKLFYRCWHCGNRGKGF